MPYQAILGEAFASLDANVRRAHLAPLAAEGSLDVEHGDGWLTPVLIHLLKLPAAGRDQRSARSASFYSAATGVLPWSFGWVCVFNDLIWWPVFWAFALTQAKEPV